MGKRLFLLLFLVDFSLYAAPRYEDDFRLMSFNVFLIPTLLSHWGQEKRAGLIAEADFIRGQDLVILNELFDNSSSRIVLEALKAEYPYQTSILAAWGGSWDASLGNPGVLKVVNGGVAIVSRWPIVEKIQWIYAQACGGDYFTKKGFVYTKIIKNGLPYHVIGTHMQSEAEGCTDDSAIRASQFDEMRRFIVEKNIPSDQILFLGGDLNVIKDTPEYYDMIQRLQVVEPTYAGHFSSWDPIGNGAAYGQYPKYDHSEYLDYIFYSADHARPSHWHNQSFDIPSPRWAEGNYYYQEYSDHYPVSAFAYADSHTPTHSFRPVNLPYDTVYFKQTSTGQYISANESVPNDWLKITTGEQDPRAAFALDNWYPAKHSFCIRSGDFVQIQSKIHPEHYWNWFLGLSGSYGYYLKKHDSSDQLRLLILDDHGDCLRNGDQVYFVDKNTVNGKDTIVQYRADGLFLGSSAAGLNETFTVEIPNEPVYGDWTSKLIYKD